MNVFFESKFLLLLTGFRRSHSTQNALPNMTEKCKHALDKSKKLGTIMDLSKAFNTHNYNLLFAKLNVYGLSFNTCMAFLSFFSFLGFFLSFLVDCKNS